MSINSLFDSFSADDIKLNSVVFHWPDHIQKIFDLARNRIDHRKDLAMAELKKKYVIIFFNQFTQWKRKTIKISLDNPSCKYLDVRVLRTKSIQTVS